MATFFHGNTEIQGHDGLQTLLLMKPSYLQYSDTPPPAPGNFVFPTNYSHAPQPHTQQFVGIPLPVSAASATSQDHNSQSVTMNPHHEIAALHGFEPRIPYNVWNSIDPNAAARASTRAHRGLSLSLSSQNPAFGSFRADREIPSQGQAKEIGEDVRISGGSSSSVSGVANGVSGIQNVLLSSKYIKAAQELLEEVVNVGNGIKTEKSKNSNGQKKVSKESSPAAKGDGSTGGDDMKKRAEELSTADRHEIQMKKAKLINMLDEVDQRYRQYHHQMQIVISSFEQATGIGSAKTYTSLALETISKQFRCLKGAITGQIQAANKKLGVEDCLGGKLEGSRLKFVDNHIRQQRALQQLGMIQHNTWRPQRGLPERSVSVLRAWLFEHFLHPYPKDSDKHMLAKQTGLTRSQVSNWFINARVRLWKPMVEEMYTEEIKQQEQNNNSEEKTSSEGKRENSGSKSSAQQEKSCAIVNQTKNFESKQDKEFPSLMSNIRNQSGFSFMGLSEMEGIGQASPKKIRNESEYLMIGGGGGGPANFIGGFGENPMEEIGRFGARFSGNGVSLTLGLPHCENNSMGRSHHQNFLQNQSIEGSDFGAIDHSSDEFESMNIQNSKRFAAQLLPDFVS